MRAVAPVDNRNERGKEGDHKPAVELLIERAQQW
jgi:hypothetical protein